MTGNYPLHSIPANEGPGPLVPERKDRPGVKRCLSNNQRRDTIAIEAPKPLDVSMLNLRINQKTVPIGP